jgi:hypothetical protein
MDKKILLLFAIFGILLAASMFTTYAIFSGSHTIYTNKTTAVDFCIKCHPTKVSIVNASAHANVGCICHGYNPNINETYNLNAAHNLTKNIYCTNCHSNYEDDGNITIHQVGSVNISGINQSAHYITSDTATLYRHAKQFFANSSG